MADVDKNETGVLIASNKVEGTSVYDSSGENIGSIYNFMVNKKSGKVDYAVLQFGGFLGLGADYYPVPWQSLTYDTSKGGYVTNISRDKLKTAPHYAANAQPSYDRGYGQEVYGHYGETYPT